MKTLYPKSGFALVTVLILLVGLSLAGAGLTYKLIYETRLVDSWQQREVANTTSETGIESAKRWLESELDKGTVFSEGSVIKADDGSPNYCLKGFKVDEITSLKTETVLLSTELGDENFKNYSYEYYVEDITNDYNTYLGVKSNNTYLYVLSQRSKMYIYDAKTGKKSTEHPELDSEHSGYYLPGVSTDRFFIDGNNLWVLYDEWALVYDKMTGKPSSDYPAGRYGNGFHIKSYSWGSPYFYIDGDFFYHRVKEGYMHVYNKKFEAGRGSIVMRGKTFIEDGTRATGYPYLSYSNSAFNGGTNYAMSGYLFPEGQRHNLFSVSGDYIYDMGGSGDLRVYNKFTGRLSTEHNNDEYSNGYLSFNKYREYGAYGDYLGQVNDGYIYIYGGRIDCPKSMSWIPTFDILDGKPSTRHPTISGSNARGICIAYYNGKNLHIHNNTFYQMRPTNVIDYYNKYTGVKEGSFNLNKNISADGYQTQIIADGGYEGNSKTTSYYRIRSCGFGLNNSVSRVETVYSYASDTKSLAQISWKELF